MKFSWFGIIWICINVADLMYISASDIQHVTGPTQSQMEENGLYIPPENFVFHTGQRPIGGPPIGPSIRPPRVPPPRAPPSRVPTTRGPPPRGPPPRGSPPRPASPPAPPSPHGPQPSQSSAQGIHLEASDNLLVDMKSLIGSVVNFIVDGDFFTAEVVDEMGGQFPHKLKYKEGSLPDEWVRLNPEDETMTDQFEHVNVPFTYDQQYQQANSDAQTADVAGVPGETKQESTTTEVGSSDKPTHVQQPNASDKHGIPDDCMWREALDESSQKPYYYHAVTKEARWDMPEELKNQASIDFAATRGDIDRVRNLLRHGEVFQVDPSHDCREDIATIIKEVQFYLHYEHELPKNVQKLISDLTINVHERFMLQAYYLSAKTSFTNYINAFGVSSTKVVQVKQDSIIRMLRGEAIGYIATIGAPVLSAGSGMAVKVGVQMAVSSAADAAEGTTKLVLNALPLGLGTGVAATVEIIINQMKEVHDDKKIRNFVTWQHDTVATSDVFVSKIALSLLERRAKGDSFPSFSVHKTRLLAARDVLNIVVYMMRFPSPTERHFERKLVDAAVGFLENRFIGKCDRCHALVYTKGWLCDAVGCGIRNACASCHSKDRRHSFNHYGNFTRYFPLYDAVESGDYVQVRQILDSKCDVNKLKTFTTIIGQFDEEHRTLVQAWLDAHKIGNQNETDELNEKIDFIDVHKNALKRGKTPLHLAIKNNHTEIARALIDAKAEVGKVFVVDGLTARFHFALEHNHAKIIKALSDAKVPLIETDWEEYITPLCYASNKNQIEIVRKLINANAKLDETDSDKQTPLVCASWRGHTEIVTMLINANAQLEIPDKKGHTAIQVARKFRRTEVIAALMNANARKPKLTRAVGHAIKSAIWDDDFSGALKGLKFYRKDLKRSKSKEDKKK